MTKLSKYFSRHEIACQCGCGLDSMDKETLDIADEAREFVGHSITPSSGARCYEYNRKIGSNDNSQHPKCRAMDLPTHRPQELFDYLNKRYPDKYGFGLYKTFVHVDTRTHGPARWRKK